MALLARKSALTAAVVLISAVTGGTVSSAATHPAAGTATITLQPGTGGDRLEPNYVGLSTEATMLTDGAFNLPNLANYLHTLNSAGVLRIGGVSADTTYWTSSGETAPKWSTGTITPASLTELAGVLNASGWSAILTVNLMDKDPARGADEALHAKQILGPALKAIAIGNEPDNYYSDASAYFTDFESYVADIKQAAPGVEIVGPDAGSYPRIVPAFAQDEAGHPDIAELTDHHYALLEDSCANPTKVYTADDLLSTSTEQSEAGYASGTTTYAWQLGVPAALTEANSIDCGGVPGVSNTFASALWALDYSLILAQNGIVNVDFHGGFTDCGWYGTVCTGSTMSTTLTAHPVFYGMLAVGLLGTGNFLSLTNSDSADIRAYAMLNGNRLTVALIDVAASGPTTVTLNLGTPYAHAQEAELASPGGLAATSGITLGGQQIAADGTFPTPNYTPLTVQGQSTTVTLNPDSAMLIQLDNL